MEQNGQLPENGPVVVTGATGGVGSIAIDMLAGRGYEVVALTGKASEEDYLKSIGASRILLRDELDFGKRPMEKAQWAGAIDNLGGDYLTWLTRTMDYGGNIASIGLAASPALNTTVLPFILRAVCLLGINSVDTPRELRLAVWSRIGGDLQAAAPGRDRRPYDRFRRAARQLPGLPRRQDHGANRRQDQRRLKHVRCGATLAIRLFGNALLAWFRIATPPLF